jgi:hypothetical protein
MPSAHAGEFLAAPPWHSGGIPEFDRPVNWVTFDAMRGTLICRKLGTETSEVLCVIAHALAVRVMVSPGGQVLCASDDRRTSCFGRRGQACGSCEHRNEACKFRVRIWFTEAEHGTLYAHTLSVTATANFMRYAGFLQQRGRLPGEVVTNVFVEDFRRKRSGLSFRRLQFACASMDAAK